MGRHDHRRVVDADITNTVELVRYSVESWLHQLVASDKVAGPNAAIASESDMLDLIVARQRTRLATAADKARLAELKRGLDALRLFSEHPNQVLTPKNAELIRRFLRQLDDHLIAADDGRAHLLSFFESSQVRAGHNEWVPGDGFAASWAAGPTRSKHEALERGRLAAGLASEYGDRFLQQYTRTPPTVDPYTPRVTNEHLLEQTCDELISVALLPPNSGAGAAVRHLATIGEMALKRIDSALFPKDSVGTAISWRLVRVLTRIGEIQQDPAVAKQVWGETRSETIVAEARRILRRILDEEVANLNRARSFTPEAARFLASSTDDEVWNILFARLSAGKTVSCQPDGVVVDVAPFGEAGVATSREQAYTALVLYELRRHDPECDSYVARIIATLKSGLDRPELINPSAIDEHDNSETVTEVRRYAAAYIAYLHQHGTHPPLDEWWSDDDKSRKKIDNWVSIAKSHGLDPEVVTNPLKLVGEPLISAVDASSWTDAQLHRKALIGATAVDQAMARVAIHARHALRSVVAQAVLSIDGTARREAIEALRQAGHADTAAKLLILLIEHFEVRRQQDVDEDDGTWRWDWLLEQAVFCLSYTGSTSELQLSDARKTSALDVLQHQAGLVGDPTQSASHSPTRRWIRTTALLGIADLADALHDDETDTMRAQLKQLVDAVDNRLQASSIERAKQRKSYLREGLIFTATSAERRSLVAVLAMLRMPTDNSIRLLHILSGRYLPPPQFSGSEKLLREHSEAPLLLGRAEFSGTVRWWNTVPDDSDAWQAWLKQRYHVADTWDLTCWQLAEWGLQRIEARFMRSTQQTRPDGALSYAAGVRIVNPIAAATDATKRMYTVVAQQSWPTGKCPPIPFDAKVSL